MRHTAYVVAGVLESCRGRSVGTALFTRLEAWARASAVTRLELTVECPNEAARHLYDKMGFTVEGIRKSAMQVDENYMARLL